MAAPAQPPAGRASLWDQAWQKLEKEQPSVIEDYTTVAKSAGFGGPKAPFNEDIPAVVANRVNAMRSKQWKFTIGKRSIRVRDQIEKLLAAIKLFKDGVSAAANADPVHAGLPWAGICLLLPLLNNDSNQLESVASGLDFISTLVVYYRVVESCLSGQMFIEKELEDSVVHLYSLILEYQAKVARYMSRKTLSRFFRNLPRLDDWKGLQANIKAADDTCKAFLAQQNASDLQRAIEKLPTVIQKLQNAVSNDHRCYESKVIQIIENISSGMVENIHNTVLKKLGVEYLNSGQWLWSNLLFVTWKFGESGCFWLNGGVGSGKTCLASIAIESLIKDGQNIAFYYCVNRTTSKGQRDSSLQASGGSTPEEVLRSLLVQLCFRSAGASERNPLIQSYEDDRVAFLDRLPTVDQCEDGIIEVMEQGPASYILIDALDECTDAMELLRILLQVSAHCSRLKIFFTSRMHIPVTDFFKDAFVVSMTGQNAEDIRDYASNELSSEDRLRRSPLKQNSPLRDEALEVLLSQAGGMFRWVEIQLDLLSSKRLTSSIEESLVNLRSNAGGSSVELLDQAYAELFEQNTNSEDGLRQIAIAALQWVLCAVVPLTPKVLASFVAYTDTAAYHTDINETLVLDSTSNFLIVNENGFLQIAHVSVLRFIESAESGPRISLENAHRIACIACLDYIMTPPLLDWQQLRQGWEIITRLRKQRLDVLDLLPFRAYATSHTLLHLNQLKIEDRKCGKIENLLRNCISKEKSEIFPLWFDLSAKFAARLASGALPRFHTLPLPDTLQLHELHLHYPFLTCQLIFASAFDMAEPPLLEIIEMAKYLISIGARSVITDNATGRALLCVAASDGHEIAVRFLVEQGVKVSGKIEGGWTSLHYAVLKGREKIVNFLIDAGGNTDLVNSEELSHLQVAIRNGNLELVKVLVGKGSSIDAEHLGLTPLHIAVMARRNEIVKFFVLRGARVDATINAAGFNKARTLHVAAYGDLSTAIFLIERLVSTGTSLDKTDDLHRTPLHLAMCTLNEGMVEMLLHHGADSNLMDGYGYSSFDWALLLKPMFQNIDKWLKGYCPTPPAVRSQRLRESIRELCGKILTSLLPRKEINQFYFLGHYLLQAKDFEAASVAFEPGRYLLGLECCAVLTMECSSCKVKRDFDKAYFFVCLTCPQTDLCRRCIENYGENNMIYRCQGHLLMALEQPYLWERRTPIKKMSEWLTELMSKYSKPEADERRPGNIKTVRLGAIVTVTATQKLNLDGNVTQNDDEDGCKTPTGSLNINLSSSASILEPASPAYGNTPNGDSQSTLDFPVLNQLEN